jgi:D-3-phosphoglycerate dehydrogenase
MNILCTTSSFNENISLSSQYKIVKNPYKRKLTEDEIVNMIIEYQPIGMIAGVEPLTRRVLEQANTLRVVSRCGIGLDTVDTQAALELGIVVTNTPDAPTIPVAELTFGLILNLLRGVRESDLSIQSHNWTRPMGNLLYGKSVGIVGCGRIGSYVAKLSYAFGCQVMAYDPYLTSSPICELVSLDYLLMNSDIVTLHLPYSPDNHHIIGSVQLSKMKSDSILVNASRGGLVDEDALFESLTSGHLKAAALDSFEEEPYHGRLIGLDNVLLTAHIGSYASEARMMQERQSVDNLVTELLKLGLPN